MPPNESTPEKSALVEGSLNLLNYDLKSEPDVVSVQPEKKDDVIPVLNDKETAQNLNNSYDCVTCLATCCELLTECWYCIFACSTSCFEGCTCECVNGICEGCTECLQGCGDCCVACTECCQ